eukprot:TRINITY_DN890_c0_g1_i4.p1 TRINITY_DN890_c0_g1~~TRINITY_DN890_c0_g1_i4.p1  ORF type:complete len:225 (-),score=41.59 TRINITY_DN890_c0_g1_i4:77-751(-)
MYFERSQYLKAEEHFLKALKIRVDKLGEYHSRTGQTYKHMITLYQVQEKYKEAIECGNKALEIAQRVHGQQSTHVAGIMNRLGHLTLESSSHVNQEDSAAKELLEKAAQIRHRDAPQQTVVAPTAIKSGLLDEISNFSFMRLKAKKTKQSAPSRTVPPHPDAFMPVITPEMKKAREPLMREIVGVIKLVEMSDQAVESNIVEKKNWWTQGFTFNKQPEYNVVKA